MIIFVHCQSDSQKLERQQVIDLPDKEFSLYFPNYNQSQIIEDLDSYKKEMETYHPGLFWYQSVEEWDSLFIDAKVSLKNGADLLSFYSILATINANIGCGHTRINLDRTFFDGWSDTLKVFPLSVKLAHGKVYIDELFDPEIALNKGSEILSINGIPSNQLVGMTLPRLSMDGFNLTGKLRYIERRFSLLFSELIDPLTKEYKISYLTKSKEIKEVTLNGISYVTYEKIRNEDEELLLLKKLPGPKNAYYLKVQTFATSWMRSEGYNYFQFLKNTFQKLQDEGAMNLIVDLRGNGGGDDGNGSKLMSYLVDEPFGYYKSIEVLPSYDGWGSPKVTTDGRYLIIGHQDIGIHQPDKNNFKGKVFILIDGGSFSATSEFAALIHDRSRAVFIGEESGGGYYGNTSGNRRRVTLTNTNITVSIPYWKYLVDIDGNEYYGKGVPPDHKVEMDIDDLINGRDTVLDFAQSLISN